MADVIIPCAFCIIASAIYLVALPVLLGRPRDRTDWIMLAVLLVGGLLFMAFMFGIMGVCA